MRMQIRSIFGRAWGVVQREFEGALVLPAARWERRAVFLLFLLGSFFRLAGLDWGLSHDVPHGAPHHDEPHVIASITTPREQLKNEFGEYEIVRPIYMWRVVTKPIFVLGGLLGLNSPNTFVFEYVVPRSVNALMGIIGLVGIYLLGTKLAGPRAGLIALALLTFMPGHWYYSQLLKGDLLVATFDTLLLLAAVFIVERGSRFWYLFAGIVSGIALASKPSVLVILPILVVAHFWRAARERKASSLVSLNMVLALLGGVVAFALLYPYPFWNFAQFWKLLTEPQTQFFHIDWSPTVGSFLQSWREYNAPPRIFMEMIFGEVLRLAFPISAALVLVLTMFSLRTRRASAYVLTAFAAFLVYHSLSFTGPLDDRYALPLAPYVALFPALVLTGGGLWKISRAASTAGLAVAGGLLIYTAGVTLVMFPTFALAKDVRLQVVDFLTAQVMPNETIGEFEPVGRQSLPLNRDRVSVVPLRSAGGHTHVYRMTNPTYIVMQREPWFYDHAFRYQLEEPSTKEDFAVLQDYYEHIRTFGKEFTLFGRPIPRFLGTPIFDVYKARGETRTPSVTNLLPALGTATSFSSGQPSVHMSGRSFTPEELHETFVSATVDVTALRTIWEHDGDARGTIGLVLSMDDAPVSEPLPERIEDPDFDIRGSDGRFIAITPLRSETLKNAQTLTIGLFFHRDGFITRYTGVDGKLVGRGVSQPLTFRTVRLGAAATISSAETVTLPLIRFSIEQPTQ